MSWNPVLNKLIEIKRECINKFGCATYEKSDNETCVERWVRLLGNQEYIDLIKPLQFTQFNELVLVRYGNYSDVFSGESEVTPNEFWSAYNGFYQECRSVVIDIVNEVLVNTPFRKFRNLNECEETSMERVTALIKNAKRVEFSDKLDGSMQSARWYKGKIVMAGSMSLDTKNSWRLEDGYRMINANENYAKMLSACPDYTFIFEYISMRDAHIVNYTKEQEGLYLIGIRESSDGYEHSYEAVLAFAKAYDIPSTKVYDTTLDKVIGTLDDVKSNEAEGFVINIDGFKVKVKYNDYVGMHNVLSSISSINLIIRNIGDGTLDDMIAKVPTAYRDRVMKVAKIVYKYIGDTDKAVRDYLSKAPKDNKKDFMIWVDANVPVELRGHCKQLYLGQEVNYIKSGNKNSPHYKMLKEMGITNYTDVFVEEE